MVGCLLGLPSATWGDPRWCCLQRSPNAQTRTAGELVIQLVLDLLDTCNFAFTKQVSVWRDGKRLSHISAAGS